MVRLGSLRRLLRKTAAPSAKRWLDPGDGRRDDIGVGSSLTLDPTYRSTQSWAAPLRSGRRNVLRAGWKSPPAVIAFTGKSPRALAGLLRRGQQMRGNSGADGNSPDERERDTPLSAPPTRVPADARPCVLILVSNCRGQP